MSQATKLYPILTGYSRYDKTLSTRDRGAGTIIDAPILAYLIETKQGRILYDVGCDFGKIADSKKCQHYYGDFPFGAPIMEEEQRVVKQLRRLGLHPSDIDLVFCGHLHFDHGGGLCDFPGADVHVHRQELKAARDEADEAYFLDDLNCPVNWCEQTGEYDLLPGVTALETPGHTAGHMSLMVHLEKGRPIIISGDAADLQENLDEEIPPGLCYQDDTEQAIISIQKLKRIADHEKAWLWPNHDMAFYQSLKHFPQFYQ